MRQLITGDRKQSVLVTESTSYIRYIPSPLEVGQKKVFFPFCSKLAPKDCKGLLLEFPQASALVSVCYTNKYYVANVPIWQGREKKQKIMKLQFHHSDADEGDTRLAWEKGGSLL